MNQSVDPKIVVGIGEVLWDMLPTGKMLGGAPANCAYHANALGAQGVVVSAVGEDDLGREILAVLGDKGLKTDYVQVLESRDTGTVTVALGDDGQPAYTIHEAVAWDHVALTPELLSLAKSADAVCFGSLAQRSVTTRETIRAFLRATRPECLRVFDINIRQEHLDKDLLRESLGMATVLKLNDEELPYLAQVFDLSGTVMEQLVQLRDDFQLDLIAYTRGAQGSLLLDGSDVVDTPGGEAFEITDTIGAGDAFTAALILSRLEGKDVQATAKRAHDLASFVCTQSGGMPLYDRNYA